MDLYESLKKKEEKKWGVNWRHWSEAGCFGGTLRSSPQTRISPDPRLGLCRYNLAGFTTDLSEAVLTMDSVAVSRRNRKVSSCKHVLMSILDMHSSLCVVVFEATPPTSIYAPYIVSDQQGK